MHSWLIKLSLQLQSIFLVIILAPRTIITHVPYTKTPMLQWNVGGKMPKTLTFL